MEQNTQIPAFNQQVVQEFISGLRYDETRAQLSSLFKRLSSTNETQTVEAISQKIEQIAADNNVDTTTVQRSITLFLQ